MSLARYYARAGGDPELITAVAAELRTGWDPEGVFVAPDRESAAGAHARAILGILATGADTAGVKGYLRRAEEAALGTARTTPRQRGDLAEWIWRRMVSAAIEASRREGPCAQAR